MRAALVRYEAPGWGVGEVWLEGDRVVWSELPAARPAEGVVAGHPLGERLRAFFGGSGDDFADVELDLDEGFYGACERALRGLPRGEVVTYGELAALAGRPGAARAAGTFCARNRLGVAGGVAVLVTGAAEAAWGWTLHGSTVWGSWLGFMVWVLVTSTYLWRRT